MPSVSTGRDRNTSTGRNTPRDRFRWQSRPERLVIGRETVRFPDCITDVGCRFPLKEKASSVTLTKFSVPWLPTNASRSLFTVRTVWGAWEGWEPGKWRWHLAHRLPRQKARRQGGEGLRGRHCSAPISGSKVSKDARPRLGGSSGLSGLGCGQASRLTLPPHPPAPGTGGPLVLTWACPPNAVGDQARHGPPHWAPHGPFPRWNVLGFGLQPASLLHWRVPAPSPKQSSFLDCSVDHAAASFSLTQRFKTMLLKGRVFRLLHPWPGNKEGLLLRGVLHFAAAERGCGFFTRYIRERGPCQRVSEAEHPGARLSDYVFEGERANGNLRGLAARREPLPTLVGQPRELCLPESLARSPVAASRPHQAAGCARWIAPSSASRSRACDMFCIEPGN